MSCPEQGRNFSFQKTRIHFLKTALKSLNCRTFKFQVCRRFEVECTLFVRIALRPLQSNVERLCLLEVVEGFGSKNRHVEFFGNHLRVFSTINTDYFPHV